jgi:lambda repressor-like predicted transcriptional regulator
MAPAKKAPKPNRKLQPNQVDQLVADYVAGANIDTLARSFGMHRQTVRNHLLRREVTLRSDSPALSETQIDHLVELHATGLSTAKLGKQVGVGPTTVQRALKARGVKLRDRSGR